MKQRRPKRKRKEKKVYVRAHSSSQKYAALKCLSSGESVQFVSYRYHVSIQTLYRWKKQFDGTKASLEPKYCAPHTPHPNRHTEEEIKHIMDLIRRNPDIGLNELYGKLRYNYAYTRHPVSLYRFLRKQGLYGEHTKKKPRKNKPYNTPTVIGEKFQLDVKCVPRECYVGAFPDEKKFYQYTIIDEASRERFLYGYEEQNSFSTIDFVTRAILYFGYIPRMIQTDNGSEFTYTRETKNDLTHPFDEFCEKNGIEHKLIRPRTPRHNGKVERSHRNDNERFYSNLKFYSLEDLQLQMKAYLKRSNNIPISTLKSNDGKRAWLSPNMKREELLALQKDELKKADKIISVFNF